MPALRTSRWQKRTALNLVFCTCAAAVLGLATQGVLVSDFFVVSYAVGFFVQFCTWLGSKYAPPKLPRSMVVVAMTGCGLVLGLGLAGALVQGYPTSFLGDDSSLLVAMLICAVVAMAFEGLKRLWDARERLTRAEREALGRDKALAEAELRVLQAQVEPHFLFNTLANVISLIHTKPDRAALLLERLTSLLRASLSRARRADWTLEEELAVVRDYLDIQTMRMGGRMTYDVEVEPGLGPVRMPPLLVQPLVENAVLHGIEPCATRGHVLVRAERANGAIRIHVADSGVGLDPASAGHGVGIANVPGASANLVRSVRDGGAFREPWWRRQRGTSDSRDRR